ncbi:DUF4097 family beta strand repeat-containing protein [Companilactobacillus insicii]|uniref:DUF4097 family beta strand repeat-containing protein n=1 Tax=Companilactobacillus insicii TaxID=1732567 RepID=UPI000F78C1C5|nr:DUF4097 family beta strand repeat-containing protein [Companilactobacillus insicii]
MRKYFVIGFYLIIIGGLLLGGGLVMGAEKTVLWDHGFKISKQIDKTESVKKFDKIKVDSDAYSVNIETGDRYKVHIVGDKLRTSDYYVSDGTLHISGNASGKYSDIISGYKNPRITVTMPMGSTLKELNLNMNQLGMDVNGVKIDNLLISNGSNGSLNFIDSEIKNAKNIELDSSFLEFQRSDIENFELKNSANSNIQMSESNIKNSIIHTNNVQLDAYKSVLENLTFATRNGHVGINQSTVKGKNTFNLKNGSFSAKGVNVEGLDLSTINGNVAYYGQGQGKSYQNNSDSENLLRVVTVNGSIEVGGN